MEAAASQPPVVSGAAAGVTPVAGGASMPVLPSVVEGLARFFMGLSSSSSLGAMGDFAGVATSAAASRECCVPYDDCWWGGHYLCCGCDACWSWRFACCSHCCS